jgi:hypothetical protein
VLISFSIAHHDLLIIKVEILDPQSQAIHPTSVYRKLFGKRMMQYPRSTCD